MGDGRFREHAHRARHPGRAAFGARHGIEIPAGDRLHVLGGGRQLLYDIGGRTDGEGAAFEFVDVPLQLDDGVVVEANRPGRLGQQGKRNVEVADRVSEHPAEDLGVVAGADQRRAGGR